MWMRLASLGITAEDVIARGGINSTLKGKSATVADLPPASDLQRELAEAEAGDRRRQARILRRAQSAAARAPRAGQGEPRSQRVGTCGQDDAGDVGLARAPTLHPRWPECQGQTAYDKGRQGKRSWESGGDPQSQASGPTEARSR